MFRRSFLYPLANMRVLRSTGSVFVMSAVLCCIMAMSLPESSGNGALLADTTDVDTSQVVTNDTLDAASEMLEAHEALADTAEVAAPAEGDPAPGGATRRAGDDAPEDAIQFSSRDSLVIAFGGEEGDVASLFGEAAVSHQDATLEAYRIDMLMQLDELRASAQPDTDEGMPSFGRGSDGFTGRELAYNLRTDRGRVVEARTQIDEGYIQGDVIKVMDDGTRYAQGGRYTTCDISVGETPSYSLRSSRMKEEDEWVYTGPIQLYIFEIPTPFILPLGFLPSIEGRRSGPLPPQYGEDQRGFYLRGWGYYWAISDYMDFESRFGIWSQGSWEVSPRFRYSLRDRYSGNVGITYIREQRGDIVDPDHSRQVSQSIRWNHQQTLSPRSRFNASVDLSNTNYLRTNTENYQDQVRQQIGSNIRYSRNFRTGQSLNLSLTHRQTLSTGDVTMQLPSLSFSQNTFQPFQRDERPPGQDERWYERISTSYTGRLNNRVRYNPQDREQLLAAGDTAAAEANFWDVLSSPDMFRRVTGQDGAIFNPTADHRIPVNTSFRLNELPLTGTPMELNINPRLNYRERWFMQTQRREFDESQRITSQETGFFALREFDLGVSADTRFFGTFPFEVGGFSGMRHTVNPSLSFTYEPDYTADFWGYMRTAVDDEGEVEEYPIRNEVRTTGMRQTISASVRNEFQTRRVGVDEDGERSYSPVNLLNLDFSTGYNLAADSLGLQNISMRGRTNIVDDVNIRFNASFIPYQMDGNRRVNRLQFAETPWMPLNLDNLRLSASTSFQGGGERRGRQQQQPDAAQDVATRDAGMQDPQMRGSELDDPFQEGFGTGTPYADFSIPWSFTLDFSGSYRPGRGTQPATKRATVNSRFDFNLTPNWAISGNTGVDLVNMELARTQLNVSRDLGCWQMTFHWTPFGSFQQFGFSLFVSSGALSDLLRLDVPSSDTRGRFQQAGPRF